MKQLLIITVIFLLSCNNDSKTKFIPHSDTTKIQAVYIDFSDSMRVKNGVVFEIVKDIAITDSFLNVKKLKDTIFFYKPSKDTTGFWSPTRRPAISTDRNLDSAIFKVLRFSKDLIKIDSTKFKK